MNDLAENTSNTKTILVVDDDELIRTIAARALRMAGYEVIEAAGGLSALHTNRTHQGSIDILVTDIVMRECDGNRVADAVEQARPDTKIILISGHMHTEEQFRDVLTPSRTLLVKPFKMKELTDLVAEVLER